MNLRARGNYVANYFLVGLLVLVALAAAVFLVVTAVIWGPVVGIGWCFIRWLRYCTDVNDE